MVLAEAQFEGVYFAPGAVEVSDRELDGLTMEQLSEKILGKMQETYAAQGSRNYTAPVMRELERVVTAAGRRRELDGPY